MKSNNKLDFGILCLSIVVGMFIILGMNYVSAGLGMPSVKQGEITTIRQTCGSCSYVNLTIYYPNSTKAVNNVGMTNLGGGYWEYNFSNTIALGRYDYPTCGDIDGSPTPICSSSESLPYFEVTPTGVPTEETGILSVGILLFYLILAITFIFLGFFLMKNKSIWITYSGLFLIIIGFTFVYYDLHLSNLYALTIASNSGASTTTSGIFVMITKLIKLAPYLVALIIAFFSYRFFKEALSARKNNDGWDDNAY